MAHIFHAARDRAGDTLLAAAASAYVLGFLAAIEFALAKLSY
jgi:hypothetical protein